MQNAKCKTWGLSQARSSCHSSGSPHGFPPDLAVGANLEEAKAGSSKREFLRYVEISLRESRETVSWLRICAALELGPPESLTRLTDEGQQISRILGAIAVKVRHRLLVGYGAFIFCILHFAF